MYVFRVDLLGVSPPVWREIQVPSSYSFWDLHVAIQDAMGWLDCHLHIFRMQDQHTGKSIEIGIPDDEEISREGIDVLAGWDTLIQSFLNKSGQSVDYEYDFGDEWEHKVLLQEIVFSERSASYPQCTGGERACPPEDCGGIRGYQFLLEAINDSTHEEHDELLQWLGGAFDPERFDSATVKFDDPKMRWQNAFEHRS